MSCFGGSSTNDGIPLNNWIHKLIKLYRERNCRHSADRCGYSTVNVVSNPIVSTEWQRRARESQAYKVHKEKKHPLYKIVLGEAVAKRIPLGASHDFSLLWKEPNRLIHCGPGPGPSSQFVQYRSDVPREIIQFNNTLAAWAISPTLGQMGLILSDDE